MKSTRILHSTPSGRRRHSQSHSQYFIWPPNTSPGLYLSAVTRAILINILCGKIFHSLWPPASNSAHGYSNDDVYAQYKYFLVTGGPKRTNPSLPSPRSTNIAFYDPSQLINTPVKSYRNDFTVSLLCMEIVGLAWWTANPCYTYIYIYIILLYVSTVGTYPYIIYEYWDGIGIKRICGDYSIGLLDRHQDLFPIENNSFTIRLSKPQDAIKEHDE